MLAEITITPRCSPLEAHSSAPSAPRGVQKSRRNAAQVCRPSNPTPLPLSGIWYSLHRHGILNHSPSSGRSPPLVSLAGWATRARRQAAAAAQAPRQAGKKRDGPRGRRESRAAT